MHRRATYIATKESIAPAVPLNRQSTPIASRSCFSDLCSSHDTQLAAVPALRNFTQWAHPTDKGIDRINCRGIKFEDYYDIAVTWIDIRLNNEMEFRRSVPGIGKLVVQCKSPVAFAFLPGIRIWLTFARIKFERKSNSPQPLRCSLVGVCE